MTVYAISKISIKDKEIYDRFWSRFQKVVVRFGGEILSADHAPVLAEGDWAEAYPLLVSFPSETDFKTWCTSLEYRKLEADKTASTSFDTALVKEYMQQSRESRKRSWLYSAFHALRAQEKIIISVLAAMVLFSLLIVSAQGQEMGLAEALEKVDWQVAVLITIIVMMITNTYDRWKR